MKTILSRAEKERAYELMRLGNISYELPDDIATCVRKRWAFWTSIARQEYMVNEVRVESSLSRRFEQAAAAASKVRAKKKMQTSARWFLATKKKRPYLNSFYIPAKFKQAFLKPKEVEGYSVLKDGNVISKCKELERFSSLRRMALGLKVYQHTTLLKQRECFSVELEFVAYEQTEMADSAYAYPFSSNVTFVGDGSVSPIGGQVNTLYKEVRINMQWGKVDKLYEICTKLRRDGAAVNKSCGLHIHLDSRHLTVRGEATRRARLVAALPWLMELVPESRRNNSFCLLNHLPGNGGRHQRYSAINPTSFRKHKTTEIRLGSGTMDPDKVLNWATLLRYISDSGKRFRTFESFLESKAPQHIKIWAVLRRNKFFPSPGQTNETSENI